MDEGGQRFHPSMLPATNDNEGIIEALRREADQAEASAKRLRELANALENGTGAFLPDSVTLGTFIFHLSSLFRKSPLDWLVISSTILHSKSR